MVRYVLRAGSLRRFLVDTARDEGRVILSCDRLFFQRRASRQAYWVQGKTKQQQMQEVLEAFELVLDQSNFMSRCGKCNGDFIPRQVLCTARDTLLARLAGSAEASAPSNVKKP